jgi:tetratricopeptide (TPR) repeat protein
MEEAISSPILQQSMHQMSEGKELLEKGNIAKGVQLLEEAISGLSEALVRGSQSLNPCKTRAQVTGQVLAEARYLAGTSEQGQGNFARALLHFQSGAQECPEIVANIPAFYYGMATSQAVIGDLAGALENFRGYDKAIKQGNFAFSPMQSMMLSFNIGQTLVRMQRSEEALAAFQLILAASANDEIADEAPQESHQNKERSGLLNGKRNLVAAAHYWAGTKFTCCTRTKVQILTPEHLRAAIATTLLAIHQFTCFTRTKVQILTPEHLRAAIATTLLARHQQTIAHLTAFAEMVHAFTQSSAREREREREFVCVNYGHI